VIIAPPARASSGTGRPGRARRPGTPPGAPW
jgi:hypothetical protein